MATDSRNTSGSTSLGVNVPIGVLASTKAIAMEQSSWIHDYLNCSYPFEKPTGRRASLPGIAVGGIIVSYMSVRCLEEQFLDIQDT